MGSALENFWSTLGTSPDEASLRRYYQALLATDLLVPILPAVDGHITPHLIALEDQDHALAFDTDARLIALFEDGSERIELSGAALLEMLGAKGLGLALNPGHDAGQFFLPPDVVRWLVEGGVEDQEKPIQFKALKDVSPDTLAQILHAVATLSGRAEHAILVASQSGGLVLVLIEADPTLAPNLARLLSLIATEPPLELLFLTQHQMRQTDLNSIGLGLEIPAPQTPKSMIAPGSDPEKPPRLT